MVIIGNGIAGRSAALAAYLSDPKSEIIILGNEGNDTYSACALPFILSGHLKKESLFLPPLSTYRRISVMGNSPVSEIDLSGQNIYTFNGKTYQYDALVLALGGSARNLFFRDDQKPVGLFYFKTINDTLAIKDFVPKKVCVIGAGLVGVEVAASLTEAGVDVSLIEAKNQVLPNVLDAEPAGMLEKNLAKNGVNVLTGVCVDKVQSSRGKVAGIDIGNDNLECDMLIISAGIIPNTTLAQQSGIEVGISGAIKVDSEMKTSASNVFACGDCAESYDLLLDKIALHPLWSVAKMQGQVAGMNSVGQRRKWPGTFSLTATSLFGVPVASLGLSSSQIEVNQLRVEEAYTRRYYKRLLFVGEKLMGAQSYGDPGWMVGLSARIGKKEEFGFTNYIAGGGSFRM